MKKPALNDVRKEPSRLDDRRLITQFHRSRDERAFGELVSRHGPMVLRVCRRILRNEHDAEDVGQAVFLLLARKSGQVRWHACVANWLYGVAVRIALQENRRMTKHREQPLVDTAGIASPDEDRESREAERMLYEELHGLPDKYRAPVILCHLEGKTRHEAADELGVNETTVKGRLERGREMLRRRLSRRGVAVPVALFSGELAARIAEAAVSESTTTLIAQAATNFAVGSSAAGASANAAVAIAKGELGKMLLAAQIKWAAVSIATLGAVGTGTVLVSQNASPSGAAANEVAAAAGGEAATSTPLPGRLGGELLALADGASSKGADEQKSEALNRRTVTNALKTFGIAMHNYHDANGTFPPAANYDANQKKLLSWRVHILPFINEQELYNQFRLNEPWNSPHNKTLIKKMPAIFAGGSDTLQKSGKTVFLVPVGEDTVFGGRDPVAIKDIADGTSNTIMVLTVKPQHAVEWTRPEEWELDEAKPFEELTGQQGMGFQFIACDGAAHHRPRMMTLAELKALLSKAGGEVVNF